MGVSIINNGTQVAKKSRSRKSAATSPAMPVQPVMPASIDSAIAMAHEEQRHNATYRALIEANERLIQQVFDLASIVKSGSTVQPAPVQANHIQKSPEIKSDTAKPAMTPAPSVKNNSSPENDSFSVMASTLRTTRGMTPERLKAKDLMMQAIRRNLDTFGGSMTRAQCAAYLDISTTTVYNYAKEIKKLRENHSAN